jgi:hypothetical protein
MTALLLNAAFTYLGGRTAIWRCLPVKGVVVTGCTRRTGSARRWHLATELSGKK